jgi:hypothetical protein
MASALLHDFVKHKLSTDYVWACRALVKIYEKQTSTERACGSTVEDNGVGFSGAHAEFLSSLAQQHLRGRKLSEKQLKYLYKYIPRYHNQIIELSNKVALEAQANAWRTGQLNLNVH